MDFLAEINAIRGRVQFSWAPPPIQQQNGFIIDYYLDCTAETAPMDTVVMAFPPAASRQYTAVGFAALTEYMCRVSARTSGGAGPAAVFNITTGEDGEYIM